MIEDQTSRRREREGMYCVSYTVYVCDGDSSGRCGIKQSVVTLRKKVDRWKDDDEENKRRERGKRGRDGWEGGTTVPECLSL